MSYGPVCPIASHKFNPKQLHKVHVFCKSNFCNRLNGEIPCIVREAEEEQSRVHDATSIIRFAKIPRWSFGLGAFGVAALFCICGRSGPHCCRAAARGCFSFQFVYWRGRVAPCPAAPVTKWLPRGGGGAEERDAPSPGRADRRKAHALNRSRFFRGNAAPLARHCVCRWSQGGGF